MSLDAATLALVAGELKNTLLDAKIDKIFEPTRDEVLMTLRTRTETHRLLLSARSGSARVCLTKESFERWYASQTDYRTVEDQELDADIMASTYGLPEMARMLGVHRQTIYYIVANEDFELIKVGRYKRATKESFEKWYQNQTRYQLAEDRQERS